MSLRDHPTLAPYGIESHWLPAQQQHDGHTLLVAYAHPDDETFTNGGTIARLSAAGVAVHCVCATRGAPVQSIPSSLYPLRQRQ